MLDHRVAAVKRIGCLLAAEPASAAVQQTLLEIALAHSPRVEEAGSALVYFDASGLEGLYGSEPELAQHVVAAAAARELRVRVGIASSRLAAFGVAKGGTGVAVIAPGEDAAFLAAAPLGLLPLSSEMALRLRGWGLRTLGDLVALPTAQLFERLGDEGLRLQRLARGEDPRPLHPFLPEEVFEESVECGWGVETLEPLRSLVADLAERLCERLAQRGLAADGFTWSCRLAGGAVHEGECAPAAPVSEASAIATLVQASLVSRPPRAPVEAITLRACPVRSVPAQGAFTDPARSSPRLVAATLARLAALVGADRIGVPALLDSHRPDAVTLTPLRLDGPSPRPPRGEGRVRGMLTLRRIRPPIPARVTLLGGRPVSLASARLSGRILAGVGPWRTSGEWWSERKFLRDEWDVELGDGTLCRLAHNGSAWFLDGLYD